MNSRDPDVTRSEPLSRTTEESLGETRASSGETTSSGHPTDARADAWLGRQLGKYKITGVLGVGGMGVVLKAHDQTIGRDVAIKVLPPEVSSNERALTRFLFEAKSAGKLSHPNTVMIHEISHEGDTHFIVMEIVSGGSLSQQLDSSGASGVQQATEQIIQASAGLAAAHQAGLIHRDVKPANLMLTPDGTVKVSDFGLAKRVDSSSMQVTQAGQLVGTPYYMSPEQCESSSVDERSDIYALGATYYSLLTGKHPFAESDSVVKVMFAHCNAPRPDPRSIRDDVPSACASVIKRAMAKRPEDRYQSMNEMRSDLQAILDHSGDGGTALPSQEVSQTSQQGGNRRLLLIGATLAATAGILGFGLYTIFGGSQTGSGEGTAAAPEANSSVPVQVIPSGEPIKVGVLHSTSGTMAASEKAVVDATLMAIDEINQAGGLMGRPVVPIVADGQSDPAVFASKARQLIESDGVCAVFGCWTSASRKTVVPIFEQNDHLLIYPVQYEGVEESSNVIYTGASPNQQIVPAVKWAFAFEDKRRFFVVGSDYVFPRVASEIIKDQLAELGAELVGEEFLPLGSTDAATVVKKISESNADMVLNLINGDTNTTFFKEMRAAGITPEKIPTISFSIGEAELAEMDSGSMAGDYAAWNYFQSIDTPENNVFVQSLKDRYGVDRTVSDPMEAAYFGVKLWSQAVLSAESTNASTIRREMRNQRMVAPEGVVRIDPATQHTFKTPRIGRVQSDGQFEIVWTAVKEQPPLPYPASRPTAAWKALLHDLYSGWGNRWSAPSK
ncbi:MAG: transporter substrate-binding protein [Rubripirellula sp.]